MRFRVEDSPYYWELELKEAKAERKGSLIGMLVGPPMMVLLGIMLLTHDYSWMAIDPTTGIMFIVFFGIGGLAGVAFTIGSFATFFEACGKIQYCQKKYDQTTALKKKGEKDR